MKLPRSERNEMKTARVLIVDDLFGRSAPTERNRDRENICGAHLLRDITGDNRSSMEILKPTAEAYFIRGQTPQKADTGDMVENRLKQVLETIREKGPFDAVLCDLHFATGRVRGTDGVPEGRDADRSNLFGLEVLKTLQREMPGLPTIAFTSESASEIAIDCWDAGIVAFVPKSSIRR